MEALVTQEMHVRLNLAVRVNQQARQYAATYAIESLHDQEVLREQKYAEGHKQDDVDRPI